MRIPHLLAAGLLFAGLGVTTTASAQSYGGGYGYNGGYDYSDRDGNRGYGDDRRDYRDDQRDYRHDEWRDGRGDWRDHRDNGWHNGWRNGWNRHHRHCWVEWRHHRRVEVCR